MTALSVETLETLSGVAVAALGLRGAAPIDQLNQQAILMRKRGHK